MYGDRMMTTSNRMMTTSNRMMTTSNRMMMKKNIQQPFIVTWETET